MSKLYFNQLNNRNSFPKQTKQREFSTAQNLDRETLCHQAMTLGNATSNKYQNNSHCLLGGFATQMPQLIPDQDKASICTNCDSSFLGIKACRSQQGKQAMPIQQPIPNGFDCPTCQQTGNSQCELCHGQMKLKKESGLIKFFEYILEFKLGRKAHNKIGNDGNEGIDGETRPCNYVKSNPKRRLSQKNALSERKNQCLNVHYGYFCNLCNDSRPIVGSKFTCPICDDFDLCQKCYLSCGHNHPMTELAYSPCYRNNMNYLNKMISEQDQIRSTVSGSPIGCRIEILQNKLSKSCRG